MLGDPSRDEARERIVVDDELLMFEAIRLLFITALSNQPYQW